MGQNGVVQKAIVSVLSKFKGQKFYVNAKSTGSNYYLYKYGKTEYSEEELYHYVNSERGKECLVFKVDEESGNLVAEGVDCESKYQPLCLQIDATNLAKIETLCDGCTPGISECKKWVDLKMYPYNGYTVEGANLCVSPCGEESYEEANMFCEVILVGVQMKVHMSKNTFTNLCRCWIQVTMQEWVMLICLHTNHLLKKTIHNRFKISWVATLRTVKSLK